MAYVGASIIASSAVAAAHWVPQSGAPRLQATVSGTMPVADRPPENMTVIHKDPDGLWPGGRRWIGVEKQDARFARNGTVPKVIVIDPQLGYDV